MQITNILITLSLVLASAQALPHGIFDFDDLLKSLDRTGQGFENKFFKPIDQVEHKIEHTISQTGNEFDHFEHTIGETVKDGIELILKGIPSQSPVKGIATWYGQESMGSCGKWYKNEDFIVALSQKIPYNKFCGRKIQIHYKDKHLNATIADTCESCLPPHVDLSRGLFSHLTDGDYDIGEIKIDWNFIDVDDQNHDDKHKGQDNDDDGDNGN